MRSINSIIRIAIMMCAVAFCATSCLKDEGEMTNSFNGFFSVTGVTPNYVLIDDAGNTFYPTITSVNAITNSKGFQDAKRVQLYGNYLVADDTENADGTHTIKNVELTGGMTIKTADVKTLQQAKDQNLLSNDSIFAILQLNNSWIANGYLNTLFAAQYSAADNKAIVPTLEMMIDDASIKDNEVSFTMLYNRHSSKNVSAAGSSNFINSFDISKIQIPGNDTVRVTIIAQGIDPYTYKVARKYFTGKR